MANLEELKEKRDSVQKSITQAIKNKVEQVNSKRRMLGGMNLLEDHLDAVPEMIISFLGNSMVGIVYALEAKDAYSCRHSQRVSVMCSRFAKLLNMRSSEQKAVSLAASIHDIGKIGIPDSVLLCPRRLTDEEFAVMKTHPVVGAEIIQKTVEEQGKNLNPAVPVPPMLVKLINVIKDGILHHHERWDGKGYPGNLAGDEIPYISRIIALADSTDAMLSSRVYRKALDEETVKAEIKKNAGIMYDPDLAELFVKNWDIVVGDLYKVTDVQNGDNYKPQLTASDSIK